MIADALSLEAQISSRLDAESARLKILADAMGKTSSRRRRLRVRPWCWMDGGASELM